ncbi:MAG: hypothetical protein ABI867_35680 [Kofleriaceae bacterium]
MIEPYAGIEIVDPTHETSIDELCAIIATALEHQRTRTNGTAITHVGTSSAGTNDAGGICDVRRAPGHSDVMPTWDPERSQGGA